MEAHNIPLHVYTIVFIHSSISEHLDCLYFLAIVSNTVINMGMQISFWELLSGFFFF